MVTINSIKNFNKTIVEYIYFDLLLFISIYFLPSLSHNFAFPIYYIDPMRIAMVLCICHTKKINTIFIVISLPIFSFALSSHPFGIKAILISSELMINIIIYYWLNKKIQYQFISMIIGLLISKIFYYSIKYSLLSYNIIYGSFISTPVSYQLTFMFFSSLYIYLILDKNHSKLVL